MLSGSSIAISLSQRRAPLCRLTAEEFDPHSKVSRLHLAAEIIAQQRSRMAAELPPMRTATNGLSGRPPYRSPIGRHILCSIARAAILSNWKLHDTTYDPSRLLHLIICQQRYTDRGPLQATMPAAPHRHQLTTSLQEDRCVIIASSLSQRMHARALTVCICSTYAADV